MATTLYLLRFPPFISPPSLHARAPTAPPTNYRGAARVSTTPPLSSSVPKKKVLVPVAFGSEEMEAVILVDVLRRAGADVTLASVEKDLNIECSSRTKLLADALIAACADDTFDLVALPGGMPGSARLRDCEVLERITRKQAEEKRLYGAICAAPAVVLLPWGLMKGMQMTGHPAFKLSLPTFWRVESIVQVSDELTTSRGPGTAFEFALSFVQQLFGDEFAGEIKELLIQPDGVARMEEFNKKEWSFNRTPQVLIPIANGSEEMDIVTVVDVLRRAKAQVVVASVEKSLQIVACQKTKIVADLLIDAAAESIFDVIVLPGGTAAGSERLHKSKVLKKLLKKQEADGRVYGAIGPSLVVLQQHGLLEDKRVTANASIIDKLKCPLADNTGVVIDGKLITSKGCRTVIDFSLAIVNKLFGRERVLCVAEGLAFKYPKQQVVAMSRY